MYLRRHRRWVNGCAYEYWTLVESRRTASGPRQHTVASLGKLPGLDDAVHAGWESMDDLLEGRTPARQLELSGPAQPSSPPLWREVDVRGVRVERVREFGQVYLALSLWRRLGLHTLLEELIPGGREAVPWERIGCLLTIARFCAQASELGVAERCTQIAESGKIKLTEYLIVTGCWISCVVKENYHSRRTSAFHGPYSLPLKVATSSQAKQPRQIGHGLPHL